MTLEQKIKAAHALAKLTTMHPEKQPYVSFLFGEPDEPYVCYPDVIVGYGSDGEKVFEEEQ